MKEIIGAQGEITIIKIDALPEMQSNLAERVSGGSIVSHSESGNHHLLEHADVLERTDVPAGMRILYAVLDSPDKLYQDTSNPHEHYDLEPGVYEFRCAREYNPFSEQARRVAD